MGVELETRLVRRLLLGMSERGQTIIDHDLNATGSERHHFNLDLEVV
jgi:hypothetical protein